MAEFLTFLGVAIWAAFAFAAAFYATGIVVALVVMATMPNMSITTEGGREIGTDEPMFLAAILAVQWPRVLWMVARGEVD